MTVVHTDEWEHVFRTSVDADGAPADIRVTVHQDGLVGISIAPILGSDGEWETIVELTKEQGVAMAKHLSGLL